MKTKNALTAPQPSPRQNAGGGCLERLVRLLDDCDAAMTAAGAQLWNQHRDLALQLNKLAARCRVEIKDMQPNKD
jgi:hypothetical protein